MIAGKKLAPVLLEETASRHKAVRPGNCAPIADGSGGYVIVTERRRASAGAHMPEACRWIRRELSVRGGVAPSAVIIVSPGSIRKTPSGKLAHATRPAAQPASWLSRRSSGRPYRLKTSGAPSILTGSEGAR